MATTQPRDFGFGEEEQMVRDSVARYLADNAGIESLRGLVASDPEKAYGSGENPAPWNEQTWQGLVELGVSSLAVPESNGGAGMKMVAVAAVAEEAGRVALPSPLVATLVRAPRCHSRACVPTETGRSSATRCKRRAATTRRC